MKYGLASNTAQTSVCFLHILPVTWTHSLKAKTESMVILHSVNASLIFKSQQNF